MSSNAAPVIRQRFFDNNGIPLNGGKITTYAAGTTTPLATYTDQTGGTPNANPVVTDSSGYCDIWLIPGSAYKFVLQDSLNNTLWTKDNITQGAVLDLNSNVTVNAIIQGFTSTVTSAGTTTLTVASTQFQVFTGATTQTVKLPVATTLANGMFYVITNNSSGVVTVQTSGANTIQAMAAGTQLTVTCVNTAGGTGTASWNWTYTSQGTAAYPISVGGTNNPSLAVTAGGMLYSDGSKLVNMGPGTTGQVPTSNGASAPTWGAAGVTGSYYSGYFDPNASWTTISTGFGDPTYNGTSYVLHQRQASGISVASAGSNLAGITFTPASNTSVYLVSAVVSLGNGTSADASFGQLVNGSGTILCGPFFNIAAGAAFFNVTFTTIFAPASSSAQTLKIQAACTAGTTIIEGSAPTGGNVTSPIEWTIVRIL
jgi:hypothetical protein